MRWQMDNSVKIQRALCDGLRSVSLSGGGSRSALSADIRNVVGRVASCSFRLFLVGGLLRDIVLSSGALRPRDIDFMVVGSSLDELTEIYRDLIYARTSLGGFRLRRANSMNLSRTFDLWRMEDTWALKERSHRKITIRLFLTTPFLNLDAVAAEWVSVEDRWQIHENGFCQGVATRCLDINYEPNPNPPLCAVRALYLAKRYQLKLNVKLANYVVNHLSEISERESHNVQLAHFGKVAVSSSDARGHLAAISTQLDAGIEAVSLK
jgi:hypothetical protein